MSEHGTLRFGHPDVWVVDSTALIQIKKVVTVSHQWSLFRRMEQMVAEAEMASPRQVYREVSSVTHPDAPGVWAAGVRDTQVLPLDVESGIMRDVMARVPNLADISKDEEDADPYVVGLARQLSEQGNEVCVVTEDIVDRVSTSIATACASLNLQCTRLREFLAILGTPYRAEP